MYFLTALPLAVENQVQVDRAQLQELLPLVLNRSFRLESPGQNMRAARISRRADQDERSVKQKRQPGPPY